MEDQPKKLIATVLSGNAQDRIEDAIQSVVDFVDEVWLLDTGITDNTVQEAREAAPGKLHVEAIGWQNDFAWARNESLRVARDRAHATWAVTVDTDERLELSGYADRNELIAALEHDPAVTVWSAFYKDRSYSKPRIIKIGSSGSWVGRTHESFDGGHGATLDGVTFWELQKSPEEFQAKVRRDMYLLLQMVNEDPENARGWYYLGQTYEGMGLHKNAEIAFRESLKWDTWNEQRAFSWYQISKALAHFNQFEDAIEACTRGFKEDSRFPELSWMISWCYFQLSRYEEAAHWATVSIALGHFNGINVGESRIGFRYLPAWYEAPYDVLRHVCAALGQTDQEAEANRCFQEALALRAGPAADS